MGLCPYTPPGSLTLDPSSGTNKRKLKNNLPVKHKDTHTPLCKETNKTLQSGCDTATTHGLGGVRRQPDALASGENKKTSGWKTCFPCRCFFVFISPVEQSLPFLKLIAEKPSIDPSASSHTGCRASGLAAGLQRGRAGPFHFAMFRSLSTRQVSAFFFYLAMFRSSSIQRVSAFFASQCYFRNLPGGFLRFAWPKRRVNRCFQRNHSLPHHRPRCYAPGRSGSSYNRCPGAPR